MPVSAQNRFDVWALDKVDLSTWEPVPPSVPWLLIQWTVMQHMGLTTETVNCDLNQIPKKERALVGMKRTILKLFKFSHTVPQRTRTIFEIMQLELLLAVGKLYTHPGTGLLCLDAYVLPFMWHKERHLVGHEPVGWLPTIMYDHEISEAEAALWRRAMPAFAERTRFNWDHKPDCDYGHNGTFMCPVDGEHQDSCLCECGGGVDIEQLSQVGGHCFASIIE
ncbi:uncharacterized protein K489DRAFT_383693 [Dissoconium aciculare CBS 342.82]|uniref:Uncharacterized protein n=1 Tax=Dissoconium aciculare CBS 342.82 TaxID=1314786 RepID=A0A6J3LUM1_9PEZI|nr:uncharacterized protein K489DRAFT_383693 [Dissoconium aciculare CBS 342.82]KAF1819475.1 hypothetical protein K489DRAFT_383693 [Dissoconium aciculare CBS 342.82]